ncbi:hypothetical protein, partial [Stenotrophomonas maltophilia]|uniref:hypothetical protein n=1 Tax=Stenotrophomonas maltophilia TaxID=40324 RepID=UPI0013DD009C
FEKHDERLDRFVDTRLQPRRPSQLGEVCGKAPLLDLLLGRQSATLVARLDTLRFASFAIRL